MDCLENMSKEELINYIRSEQYLTYEDRIKLKIFDKAPFTLWACDKEFKIRLWECQCERIYGLKKEYALGKDYLEMFVAPNERIRSRNDCIATIERGQPFSNCISHDESIIGKQEMMTNCFRICDEKTNEFLQVELGLDISNLDYKRGIHQETLLESKELSAKKEKLNTLVIDLEDLLDTTFTTIEAHLSSNDQKALECGIRQEYKQQQPGLKKRIDDIKKDYSNKIDKIDVSNINSIDEYKKVIRELKNIERCIPFCFNEIKLDADEFLLKAKSINNPNSRIKIGH